DGASGTSFDVLEGRAYDPWSITHSTDTELNKTSGLIQKRDTQGRRVEVIGSASNPVKNGPMKPIRKKSFGNKIKTRNNQEKNKPNTRKWYKRFRKDCDTTAKCRRALGHCKKECNKEEDEVPRACNKKEDCKCCAG
ncbi:unnamed protein product, partial [Meganyctiphanes norvegica]